jgi:hypothetical protein
VARKPGAYMKINLVKSGFQLKILECIDTIQIPLSILMKMMVLLALPYNASLKIKKEDYG